MFEILLPLPFLAIGIAATFFRKKFAEMFCRFGKALWGTATLGLTDMGIFYNEEKTRKTFVLLGPIFLCAGLGLACIGVLSFFGPNAFAAMRESRTYLSSTYGEANTWNVSSSGKDQSGAEVIEYRYGDRTGRLLATWQTDHYEFTEAESSTRQKSLR